MYDDLVVRRREAWSNPPIEPPVSPDSRRGQHQFAVRVERSNVVPCPLSDGWHKLRITRSPSASRQISLKVRSLLPEDVRPLFKFRPDCVWIGGERLQNPFLAASLQSPVRFPCALAKEAHRG